MSMLELEGLQDAIGRIDKLIGAMEGPAVQEAFMPAAVVVRNEAKRLAAVYDGPARPDVVPGKLRDEIFATPGAAGAPNVIVGLDLAKVPYALDIEFGNGHQAPQSFLRAARDSRQGEVRLAIETGLEKVMKDATE